ncbi:MAG: type I-MYXAN CRISPR-associated protein Cas6/Cmx6 [Burkholderiaceae bacterium]|nr:type I-MYXAN CRISPR-associated protein Cas6/Cmx6 [Burkholderiaceae bacterium]
MSVSTDLHDCRAASGAGAADDPALDLAFALSGVRLPGEHAEALWGALLQRLPWLADEPGVGVHAIRASWNDGGLLLSRRARLVLRLPRRRQADAMRLTGCTLQIETEQLEVGEARVRPLEPYPTLSARFVATGAADELAHQQSVEAMLGRLGMPLRFICGRMRTVRRGAGALSGAEVVLHDLRPEQSIAMQERGLGAGRHLGSGLFLPHKTISGID